MAIEVTLHFGMRMTLVSRELKGWVMRTRPRYQRNVGVAVVVARSGQWFVAIAKSLKTCGREIFAKASLPQARMQRMRYKRYRVAQFQ